MLWHKSTKPCRDIVRHVFCGTGPIQYLFLTVGDVTDTAPGEGLLGIQFAIRAVDMKSLGINTKQELLVSLILLKKQQQLILISLFIIDTFNI